MPDIYDRLRAEGVYAAALPMKILDLGTGGGFPGIPLAVMFPGAHFTLCDSIGKKITVAREVAAGLGLQNVTTVNARAESLPETFDFIVSRAVTALDNFMPWVKGKYSSGILYLKGGDLAEEISNAMAKFKMRKGSVHSWPISSWTNDPFFETKQVIYIEF
jgi:16S rRNA (guanine527-N7)-methyltransferase